MGLGFQGRCDLLKKIELLAPAGDLAKLKTAIDYGADAVYLAGEHFGLRTASRNFSQEELAEGIEYAHDRGKKVHVTMNIIAHQEDLAGVEEYAKNLEALGVDAVIIADMGIASLVKRATDLEIHISTQASVTNSETINFWYDYGVRRIVLARELSFEEIRDIRSKIPEDMELEMFGHGAMCIAYSGRCLLSNYMVDRDANRGDCAHACRWKYSLVEEKRPGEYFPVVEDESGTHILNSKDLCLIQYIDEIAKSGIDSLKIEGRVKSEYYVATVVRAYRMALDAFYAGDYNQDLAQELLAEIRKASHRDFTSGFSIEVPDEDSQIYQTASYIRGYDFIGKVLEMDGDLALVEQRNKFSQGDKVEVFSPGKKHFEFEIGKMYDEDGEEISEAPHAQQRVTMSLPGAVVGSMLRREIKLEI